MRQEGELAIASVKIFEASKEMTKMHSNQPLDTITCHGQPCSQQMFVGGIFLHEAAKR